MEKLPLISKKNDLVQRPLLASFLASVMSFASGTVVGGWTAPETPSFIGETLFMPTTMEQSSWIVSIYVIGALFGALPAGRLAKRFGSKKVLQWLALPMTLGWLIIMFFVNDIYLIYTGRFLCGLSLGAVTVVVPLYNYDVSPNTCRGTGGVYLDFMLCAGILYSYMASSVMGLFVFSLTCAIIPVVFFALFSFMPESPRYLHSRGRYVDAKSAIIWLRGNDNDVVAEFDRFARIENEDNDCTLNYEQKGIFKKAIILSLALATIQRLSGTGAIIQFTAKLFKLSGSSVEPITASIITGIFQLIGSGAAIQLIDKVGRRKLLLISSAVVVTCLTMLAIYFYYLNQGTLENSSLKVLPVIIVCTFIVFFRLGLGPIPWFMTTELLGGDHTNSSAQSYVATYSWLLSFFVMKTFLPLVNAWPVALWLGYSALSAIGFFVIFFYIPETNNKSSDEIRVSLMQ